MKKDGGWRGNVVTKIVLVNFSASSSLFKWQRGCFEIEGEHERAGEIVDYESEDAMKKYECQYVWLHRDVSEGVKICFYGKVTIYEKWITVSHPAGNGRISFQENDVYQILEEIGGHPQVYLK